MSANPPCTRCELHKSCNNPNIQPRGSGDIVFLGEAPGADEDIQNTSFIGRSGELLAEFLGELEIPKDRLRFTNSVRCRPPKSRPPTHLEISHCLYNVALEFSENMPSIIVPLGASALNSLRKLGILHSSQKITALHGQVIEEEGVTIFPMLHPAYLLRNPHLFEEYARAMNGLEALVKNGGVMPVKVSQDYLFSSEIDELEEILRLLQDVEAVAYDIETSAFMPYMKGGEVITFALSWEVGKAFGFELTPQNRKAALELLDRELLENPRIKKIMHHAKFELAWSFSRGRTIVNFDDTLLLHWHTDEKNGTHRLDNVALKYTDLGYYDRELEEYKKAHPEADPEKGGSYAAIPRRKILLPYNCADADATYRIWEKIRAELNERQLWVHDHIQIPSCYPFADLELNGVTIDWPYVDKLNEILPAQIRELDDKLMSEPDMKTFVASYLDDDTPFNCRSTNHVQTLLFKHLKLPIFEWALTDKGQPSTAKEVLEELSEYHPIPKILMDRNKVKTLHRNYVEAAYERRRGQKLHTSYGIANTETGRSNSTKPNLQNTPRKGVIKPMFIPDPGHYMIELDFSQIEVRIMAMASGDENLLDYFRKGLDVHRSIASKTIGIPLEKVSDDQRTGAKATVFGLCYGQGPQGLAKKLWISIQAAERLFASFFGEFQAVDRWIKKTQNQAAKTGQVETLFGRIRRLPDAMLKDERDSYRNRAMRQVINAPIQGTAVDMFYMKMAELWFALKKGGFQTRMILTVHDSLAFSVPPREVVPFFKLAKPLMEDFKAVSWVTIPIVVDFKIGRRWGELKPISDQQIAALTDGFDVEAFLTEPDHVSA